MDTVTYPRPDVVETLNRDFVCYTVNTMEPTDEGKRLLREHRLLWEPGFVFFDHRQTELRRFVGFREPHEFLAELQMVLGLVDTLYQRHAEAYERFREAARLGGETDPAPEALYWAGIAKYRRDGRSRAVLAEAWKELEDRFPRNSWWKRADVLAFTPTGRREGGGSAVSPT